jgi:hypothetical protein
MFSHFLKLSQQYFYAAARTSTIWIFAKSRYVMEFSSKSGIKIYSRKIMNPNGIAFLFD